MRDAAVQGREEDVESTRVSGPNNPKRQDYNIFSILGPPILGNYHS